MLLDLQIEEKKVDLELKKTQLEKEQLQCRELKLKIEQLEKNQNTQISFHIVKFEISMTNKP